MYGFLLAALLGASADTGLEPEEYGSFVTGHIVTIEQPARLEDRQASSDQGEVS